MGKATAGGRGAENSHTIVALLEHKVGRHFLSRLPHTFPTLFPTYAPLQVHDMIARAALEHPPPASKEPKLPLIRLRVRIKISHDFIDVARIISLIWLV